MAGYIGSKASVTQVDGYSRTEADDRYANITGDTFTGAVTGTNLTLSGGVYLGGTGAANLLDDYETGSWTPTFGSTSSITHDPYTYQLGRYIKIGKLVYAWFDVEANITSASGAAQVLGLPFNTDSTGYYNSPVYRSHRGVSIPTGYSLAGYTESNYILLQQIVLSTGQEGAVGFSTGSSRLNGWVVYPTS